MTYINLFMRVFLIAFLLGGGGAFVPERVYSTSASVVEEFYPTLSQIFPSDWEIIPIGAHSYKIIIGKKALRELAQLAEEKIQEAKEKMESGPTILPFVEKVSEGLKDLPDFHGTITGSIKVVFLAPIELDTYFSEIRKIAKKAHLHLSRSANSANWILETGYSTLPDKETAISAIEKVDDAIKENKDLALYIKQNIPEGWDFSKIDVRKVVIVLHFRD